MCIVQPDFLSNLFPVVFVQLAQKPTKYLPTRNPRQDDTNGIANKCAICYSNPMGTDQALNHYERINQVKAYIRLHMDETLNREELAQLAGYSVIHFHRIFTAHVGEPVNA